LGSIDGSCEERAESGSVFYIGRVIFAIGEAIAANFLVSRKSPPLDEPVSAGIGSVSLTFSVRETWNANLILALEGDHLQYLLVRRC
jgi:hypothetical protein